MKRAAFAGFLVLAIAISAGVTSAQTEGDTRSTLMRALALVEQALQEPESQRPGLAQAALAGLENDPRLRATDWLSGALRTEPPDLARARTRLSDAIRAVDRPQNPRLDPVSARRALLDALADPRITPPDIRSIIPVWLLPLVIVIDNLLNLLWNLIRWPFDRLYDLLRAFIGGPVFGPLTAVAALFVVASLGLLYRRALRAGLVAQAEIPTASGPLPLTAAEALSTAQGQAIEGHYHNASHYLLLWALLRIEEAGRVRFDQSATNREHLDRLAEEPSVAAALAPLVARFDRLWYGQGEASAADYQELLVLAGRVREVVP